MLSWVLNSAICYVDFTKIVTYADLGLFVRRKRGKSGVFLPASPVYLMLRPGCPSWRLALIMIVMFLSRMADSHPALSYLARWLSDPVNEPSEGPFQVLTNSRAPIQLILSQRVLDLFYNICSLFCKYFALYCLFGILDHIIPILIKFRSPENVIVVVIFLIHPLENTQDNRFSLWRLSFANFVTDGLVFLGVQVCLQVYILYNKI